ncbi:MAG: hypothetical protein V4792_16405 [Pseudomonadota bacterium]
MLTDQRIIGRLGALDIGAQRHELQLLDGSLRWLHEVRRLQHEPDLFLRAVHRGGDVFTVVDLRRLAPELAEALPQAIHVDRPGTVFYTLRHRYRTALDLDNALRDLCSAHGEIACRVPLEVAL